MKLYTGLILTRSPLVGKTKNRKTGKGERKMDTLGARIKARRAALHMTQRELSQELGISNAAVAKWELNLSAPSFFRLAALADILHCSVDALCGHAERNTAQESSPCDGKQPNATWE